MSRIFHIVFIIYVTWYKHEMTHRIAYAQGRRMKWEYMVIIDTVFGVLLGGLGTVGQRLTGSLGCIH